ncbi:MAG: HD domain-containing protein [Nanoarchaeota archaeon]|nr:HD domain-containing protein [Nanoarchaeota archaeon]MBU1135848.1 HD domain-containing protein [Nanoarchaeota archaeon]MBU2519668.1 HD domain-containing protein [Nanoarchaeota archaeon]
MDNGNKYTDEQENYLTLMTNFKNTLDRIDRVIRWEGYETRGYKQSSLEHSYLLALLAGKAIEIEKENGILDFNSEKIILHCLVHDFGEGTVGDITYKFKSDPSIKHILPEIEKEETSVQLKKLEPLSDFLYNIFQLDTDSVEERFFNALERLDYMLYAVSEYFYYDNKDFVKVFVRQHKKLTDYGQEFISINKLYQPVIPLVENALEENADYIKESKAEVEKTSSKHITRVSDALNKLLDECSESELPDDVLRLAEKINNRKSKGKKDS